MHEKAIAQAFDGLWGKSLERNWIPGRLGLPGSPPVFNAPDKPGYKYVYKGLEGEQGQLLARDRIGVADVFNQRVKMRYEFGEYVIREAEYLDSSGGLSNTLAGLTDVAITSLADGDIIQYDSGLGEWINAVAGGGGGTTYFAGDAIDIDGSNNISVKVNSSSAIVVDTGSNTLLVNTGDGLKITLNQLTLNLAPSPGLEYGTGVDAGKLRLKTNDGLMLDTNGVNLNLATDPGLEYGTSGDLHKVRVKVYFGIERTSNGIGVKLKTTSGLEVDTNGLALLDAIAGNGLVIASKILAVGAGNGINSNANDVAVRLETNSGLQFGGAGGVQLGTPSTNSVSSTNQVTAATHGHAIASSSDVGTTPVASILASNSSGQLTLAQLTIRGNLVFAGGSRSITASNSLTITPSTDLILDPTGLILTPNAQDVRTITINDLPTGIDGFRIWNRYANYTQLTIGAIKADELYIRVFVADETRIDRGEEYWSKSFGIVETDFTVPAINATVDVWFEDAPAAVTFNLFAVNDYLLCRTIDWGTGLVVQKIWFQVTTAKLAQETTAINGVDRQKWRIKRLAGGATGNLIKRGNLALDTGQVGQGWIHLSALSQDGGPFIQIGTMTSVATVPQFTNYVRMGNLNGTVDYATNVYGFAAGSSLGTTPSGGFSGITAEATNGLRLFNTAIAMYDSGVKMVRFDKDIGLTLDIDVSEDATFGRYIRWQDDVDSLDVNSNVRMGAWKVGAANIMGLMVISPAVATNALFNVFLQRSSDSAQANLDMDLTQLNLAFALNNGLFNFANTGRFLASNGTGATSANSRIHAYDNNSITGAAAGITMEQAGTGDALLQFLLTAGRRWVVGIDNSDADKFKISNNAALGAGDVLTIDTSGNVGIGTAGPSQQLVIEGADSTTALGQNSNAALRLNVFNPATFNQKGEIQFGFNGKAAGAAISGVYTGFLSGAQQWGMDLVFSTAQASAIAQPTVEQMRITRAGYVGIGNSDPAGELEVFSADTANARRGITSTQINSGAQAAVFSFLKARGTRASKTTVANGDFLGDFIFQPYDGTNYLRTAQIAARAVGTVGTASVPTDLLFATGDTDDGALSNVRMTIKSAGQVGIGATGPVSLLHVFENTSATTTAAGVTIEQAGTGDAKVQFLLSGGQRWGVGIDNSDGDKLKIASGTDLGTTPALTITTNGYLGIGVAAPGVDVIATTDIATTSLIHLDGNTGSAAFVITADGGSAISLIGGNSVADTNWLHISQGGGFSTIQSMTNGGIVDEVFFSMEHSSGYVGLNVSNPDARFDVDTDDNNGIRSTVYSDTNWFNYVARRTLGTKASPTRALLNTIIGSWGGQGYTLSGWPTVASAQIQMRASENYTATAQGSKIEFYTTLNGTTTLTKNFSIENDGGIYAPYIWNTAVNGTAVQINANGVLTKATSSIRFKKNVREMPGDFGDDFIMALKPIIYNNKFGDDAGDYVGFVAEDVFDIGGKPFVSFNDAGQVESLHYDKLTVPLVAAVQDLIPYKARIAQLESEMVELRARVNAMEGE